MDARERGGEVEDVEEESDRGLSLPVDEDDEDEDDDRVSDCCW